MINQHVIDGRTHKQTNKQTRKRNAFFQQFRARIDALEADISITSNSQESEDKKAVLEKLENKLKIMKVKRCFKLSRTKCTAIVQVTLDDSENEQAVLKSVGMSQLPINMNDATTGHVLQGMSKDKLVVMSWSFKSN